MKRPRSRGFTLNELLVVLMIIMIVAAVAIPSVMATINNIRLRSMLTTVSGVIQNGRMVAIKTNQQQIIRFVTVASSTTIFVDSNGDGEIQTSEPQAQLGGTIIEQAAPVGTDPLDATLAFPLGTGNLFFNPRGLPCTTATNCGQVGFAMYFTDPHRAGGNGYAAVSITPAGRVKAWMWNGTTWTD